jgi:mono/diheme cytochrome c family protein
MKPTFAITALLISFSTPVFAQADGWVAYGKKLVEANCGVCHAVGRSDVSAHEEAPPLRTLWQRYPIDALEEAFAEGISTGHPDMPQFVATEEQLTAIIDYIGSLGPRDTR